MEEHKKKEKPEKTPEDLAAIAYLDKLRTCEREPMRAIKFRPLPRSRKTERVRPLKTIHIAPPPRPGDPALV